MLPFVDKIALITGLGRGIGKAIALRFAEQGADVVINFFRNRLPAEQTASEIRTLGRRALVVKADVGDLDELNSLFDSVDAEFGGLDFFIHNAASGYNRPALEQKPKGWDWTMNINARALLFAAQRAVALMQKRANPSGVTAGAIVAITSAGATRVLPDYVVVGASKAALEAIVRHLAVELSPHNIVVNAVSPGMVDTEALRHFSVMQQTDLLQRYAAATPAGRLVTAEEIAGVVVFLCSPAAQMIRGQVITVDGGYSIPYSIATINP